MVGDNDDVPEAQAKGYFVGIKPYPSTNFYSVRTIPQHLYIRQEKLILKKCE